MKGNRGMTNMLKAVVQECKEEGSGLRAQIKKVGSAFINAQENAIQEATSHMLGHVGSRRAPIFKRCCFCAYNN